MLAIERAGGKRAALEAKHEAKRRAGVLGSWHRACMDKGRVPGLAELRIDADEDFLHERWVGYVEDPHERTGGVLCLNSVAVPPAARTLREVEVEDGEITAGECSFTVRGEVVSLGALECGFIETEVYLDEETDIAASWVLIEKYDKREAANIETWAHYREQRAYERTAVLSWNVRRRRLFAVPSFKRGEPLWANVLAHRDEAGTFEPPSLFRTPAVDGSYAEKLAGRRIATETEQQRQEAADFARLRALLRQEDAEAAAQEARDAAAARDRRASLMTA